MITGGDAPRDLSRLVVPLRGSLEATGDLFEPFRLADPAGRAVGPAAAYLRELAASGRAAATQRSYGMDLLRWFRFLWAVEVPWDQATRAEARDSAAGSSWPTSRPGRTGGIRAAVRPAVAGNGRRRDRRTR